MRLDLQLVSLINIYAAVSIDHTESSNGLDNMQKRSGENLFVYNTTSVECGYHDWDYFHQECVKRGHQGLAGKYDVLTFRQEQNITKDSSSSWTPINSRGNWMQIGTKSGKFIYGSVNMKTWECDDGVCDSEFQVPSMTKKEIYCKGGTPKEYNFDQCAVSWWRVMLLILFGLILMTFIIGLVRYIVKICKSLTEEEFIIFCVGMFFILCLGDCYFFARTSARNIRTQHPHATSARNTIINIFQFWVVFQPHATR